MRVFLLSLLLAVGAVAARAQPVPAAGATPAACVPAGYRLLPHGRATGDLNGDGRADVALALEPATEADSPAGAKLPPRLLLVLWRTAAGGYQRAALARRLALHRHASPYGNDPLNRLRIQRGVLLVQYDTGGNWGRSTTAKFRYQRGGFQLIGETTAYGTHHPDCDKLPFPPRYHYRDTNFLTGEYEVIKTSDACRLLVHKRGRQPLRPLCSLGSYAPEL